MMLSTKSVRLGLVTVLLAISLGSSNGRLMSEKGLRELQPTPDGNSSAAEPIHYTFFEDFDHFNVAPHSHAVEADGWVYITGQMPVDNTTDVEGLPMGIEAQTKNVFDNLNLVLAKVGLTLDDTVYTRAFLQHFQADYKKFNDVYATYFTGDDLPARTCVGTSGLAQDALVEIDLVLRRDKTGTTYHTLFDNHDHFNVAPHSHAVEADGWVYITGQMPVDGTTAEEGLPTGIEPQTENVFKNLELVLGDIGMTLDNGVYTRAFLQHFQGDYKKFNNVYSTYYEGDKLPARTCVGTTGLAQDALVEIDLLLRKDDIGLTYTYLFDNYDHFNVAPHSHAVEAKNWVYITGQMPVDETTDEEGLPVGIEAQTENVFENLKLVLGHLGLTLDNTVYTRAFLQNFQADYKKFNDVYATYFNGDNLPARTCVGTSGLAQDALVEIDLVLYRPQEGTISAEEKSQASP